MAERVVPLVEGGGSSFFRNVGSRQIQEHQQRERIKVMSNFGELLGAVEEDLEDMVEHIHKPHGVEADKTDGIDHDFIRQRLADTLPHLLNFMVAKSTYKVVSESIPEELRERLRTTSEALQSVIAAKNPLVIPVLIQGLEEFFGVIETIKQRPVSL